MSKQHINIGIENPDRGFDRFVDAWHKAENDELKQEEIHLNFEDFALFVSALTPKRLELMRALRQYGPLSVRALAKQVGRDYKNVHSDTKILEEVDLIHRTEHKLLTAPWDVIDTHVSLVA